jgi:hypothetical protein
MNNRLAELDSAIAEYLAAIVIRWQWIARSVHEQPTYAERQYVCGNVLIRVLNERGLLDLQLGSIESDKSLRSASSFRDVLDPPALGRWNFGLADAAKFLDERWAETIAMLAPGVWPATVARIGALHRRSGDPG